MDMDVDGRRSVVSEFEGTLLKGDDPFPYLMLVAFESPAGLLRFLLLLLSWPLIRALGRDLGLRVMVFIAVAGVQESEIKAIARAVLPKFYADDLDMEAWHAFSSFQQRRVVLTRCPRVMAERFARDHLGAHEVVGSELHVNRFGYATGFLLSVSNSVHLPPDVWMGGNHTSSMSKLMNPPYATAGVKDARPPLPVIFHDGRLVRRPTPLVALLVVLWIPIGVLLATIRILIGLLLPMWLNARVFSGQIIVRGRPPQETAGGGGVLFVCSHRTLMDPVVLSTVLHRKIPAVTYSISRFSEILSPIPTVRLTRDRQVDASRIRSELERGDLVVCPEGTTCREPFLLRFSALFAELTDRIVPVAMNYRVGLFHATTARGWKAMDPIFFFMNPRPVYEVTFLNQLPVEATCSAGKSPHDVANYVQRILAATLGFECTNFTRKDKYRVLAGNDGNTTAAATATTTSLLLGFNLH